MKESELKKLEAAYQDLLRDYGKLKLELEIWQERVMREQEITEEYREKIKRLENIIQDYNYDTGI